MRNAAVFCLCLSLAACKGAPGEAIVVFSVSDYAGARLFAVGESGKAQPAALSDPAASVRFGAALDLRRVLYSPLNDDASLAALRAVGVDGKGDALLGS